ncbi:MAG: YkgJ family cysteine cluster protein [Spirochaetes bacterium]|nr:YkgJ family cysteine cluster protein [Spirochaetota bacterium]MBU0956819.1 YkgJ family cysteine cluster protein [Spirochaetota bacterium]
MDFINILPDGYLKQRLLTLSGIYLAANTSVSTFGAVSNLSCPSGCGSCCEDFVPDILPVEASMLAVFLAARDRPAAYALAAGSLGAQEFSGGRHGCPLYLADNPYHCPVYEARPLICRMFPFAAVRDKSGLPRFSPCKLMPQAAGFDKTAANPLMASAPLFADYGYQLLMIDPDMGAARAPLYQLLPQALAQVLFLIGLNDNDPGSNDPGFTPLPRAS